MKNLFQITDATFSGFYLKLLTLLIASFGCLTSIAAAQGQLSVMLKFPAVQIQSGEPLALKVYFHNESADPFQGELPHSLSLRFQAPHQAATLVTAVEVEEADSLEIAPGEFAAKAYQLEPPSRYQGTVEVLLIEYPDAATLLTILPPPETQEQVTSVEETDPRQTSYPSLESLFSLYQPYVINFSAYEPMYFLVGSDPAKSKFQISFKYRLFNPSGTLSQAFPWLRGLHFAYTQTSFWDLASASAPFEDTSYKPELFLLSSNWKKRPSWLQGLFVQAGVQHESNGRGADSSRSTNSVYLKPILVFYHARTALGLQLSPKLLTYFSNDDGTNPNLDEYRGHTELEIKLGKASGLVSTTQLRFAEKGTSLQTDLTYPISKLLKSNFDMFFHVQYSNALAESLINYRDRSEALRIGFSFVR